MRRHMENKKMTSWIQNLGLIFILSGILFSIESGQAPEWLTRQTTSLWMVVTYLGVILTALSINLYYSQMRKNNPILLAAFRILIIFGILSLPIYVGHDLVIPIKDLLVYTGVPYAVALIMPMALFFGLIGYGTMKLYKVYFTGNETTA